jgi:hypothetical protein
MCSIMREGFVDENSEMLKALTEDQIKMRKSIQKTVKIELLIFINIEICVKKIVCCQQKREIVLNRR